jgi:hypothetical protein
MLANHTLNYSTYGSFLKAEVAEKTKSIIWGKMSRLIGNKKYLFLSDFNYYLLHKINWSIYYYCVFSLCKIKHNTPAFSRKILGFGEDFREKKGFLNPDKPWFLIPFPIPDSRFPITDSLLPIPSQKIL